MAAEPMAVPRWQRWLPTIGLLLWIAGAVAIWRIWKHLHREPGELVLLGSVWLIVLAMACHQFVRGMFGPVFTYEITRLGRKTFTHLLRLGYVIALSGALLLMYWVWLEEVTYYSGRSLDTVPSNRLAEFASTFFAVYMVLQAIIVAFLTPAYLAGCIADEKERKTLEFLLATDLRNHEIIFGKTAARVAFILIFVLAGLPIVALMQLFGGIDPDQLLSGTAATIIMVIGFSAISIAFSTAYKRPRNAIALTFLVILAYLVVTFPVALFLKYYAAFGSPAYKTLYFLGMELDCSGLIDWLAWFTDLMASGNPVYAVFNLALKPMGGSIFQPDEVGEALFRFASFYGIVTFLGLSYAVTRLRSVALNQAYGNSGGGVANPTKDKKPTAKPKPGPVPPPNAQQPADVTPEPEPAEVQYTASGHPPIGSDPMFWKEVFVEGSGRSGWVSTVFTIVLLVLTFITPAIITIACFIDTIPVLNAVFEVAPRNLPYEDRWYDFNFAMAMWAKIAIAVLTFIAMMAALVRGAGAISSERDRDTWISLISAPLTAWEMLRAKWLGCILSLKKVYFVMLAVWGTVLATGSMHPVMLIPSVFTTFLFISAFAWLGMFCSATARNTLMATIRALLIGLFFSGGFWVFFFICCFLPVGLLLDRSISREFGQIVEKFLWLLFAGTPPATAWFMPIFNFNRDEMGPFHSDSNDSFGPISFVIAWMFWIGFNVVFSLLTLTIFAKQCNRSSSR